MCNAFKGCPFLCLSGLSSQKGEAYVHHGAFTPHGEEGQAGTGSASSVEASSPALAVLSAPGRAAVLSQ